MTLLKTIKDLMDLLKKNDNVTILKYVKKDKSFRDVNCTLNFDIIPLDDFSKIKNIEEVEKLTNKGIISIYDNEKKDWRTLLLKNIKDIEIGQDKYQVSL